MFTVAWTESKSACQENKNMPGVSIKDVAKLAGVSIATVSRTLNFPDMVYENTRLRVEDAIRKTGYKPNSLAQNFRRGRTNVVTVVMPSIGDPFAAGVMRGIQGSAAKKGYAVFVEEKPLNSMTRDEFDSLLGSRQADGMIVIASIPSAGIKALTAENRPSLPIVIACETPPELASMPRVHIDNYSAAQDATDLLIASGHTRIGMIYGLAESPLTIARVNGFKAALEKANLGVRDDWLAEGYRTLAGGRGAARELLDNDDRPTGLFCGNDDMALGCLHETRMMGLRVPDDLSVVGFDDIQFAEVADPPLTTVSQPVEEIGKRILDRLCGLIAGDDDPVRGAEIVSHTLVTRDSVAAPSQ